jgi:maleylpyruvate isomerase
MADALVLHGFFRSTASYRVRIALGLKNMRWSDVSYRLREGEHRSPGYARRNPQCLVPSLEIDGETLTQSLAICEYLDETRPDPPLLPKDPLLRAKARAVAQVIACDTHPVQNLKVLRNLAALGVDEAGVTRWAKEVIDDGLAACEALITGDTGPFCFGSVPTLADICLIPQLVNARRFGTDVRWPRILAVEQTCLQLAAFQNAAPEMQPDAD